MSAGTSYGHDSNATNGGGEYSLPPTYLQNGQQQQQQHQHQQQQAYASQNGIPVRPAMQVHQQYMTTGEPSMRKSVEGIPQMHFQQQQQQYQHVPVASMQHGVPMVASHQQFVPAQQYQVPMQYYPAMAHQPNPAFQHVQATHVADYRFGAPQFVVDPNSWHGAGEWEDEFEEHGGGVLYGNLEVKHRRRTSPEQLRVLEHWFSINPRPDNALREWLASELGITKRNVQVWFQNRRAKIKNQEKQREAAAADARKEADRHAPTDGADHSSVNGQQSGAVTPTGPSHTGHGTPLSLPGSQPGTTQSTPSRPTSGGGSKPTLEAKLDVGRRVSLAGGDVANLESWAAKRRQHMASSSMSAPMGNSPMGLAAAARRNSQPYPTQIITQPSGEDLTAELSRSALPSPKVSPNGRMPTGTGLLGYAVRNNQLRRASMPGGGAQLISSMAFTPPRTVSYNHPIQPRGLAPIKDHDSDIDPSLRGMHMHGQNYLSVPDHQDQLEQSLNPGMPFSPNSPLPNPTFSFGSTPTMPSAADTSPLSSDPQHAMYLALQRGRLGSIASVNSVTSNATDATTTGDSDVEWPSYIPPGFDPDIRRASAPADLLHNIGLLGISSGASTQMSATSSLGNCSSSTIRPSPLATAYQPSHTLRDGLGTYELSVPPPSSGPMSAPVQSSTPTAGGGPYIPAPDSSPAQSTSASAIASEGPSPSTLHGHQTLMGPPPMPNRSHPVFSFDQQTMYDLEPALGQHKARSSLPTSLPSLPSLPEPSPSYTPSAGSSSDALASFGNDFDLGFDFGGDDRDQFTFFAELTGDGEQNVLV